MQDNAIRTLNRAEYDAIRPPWAKSVILAQLERNETDLMTDYFGSRTEATVVIGWSRHDRDLFPEMRQAAAKFPPTARYGPGRDRYTPRVVFVNDIQGNGCHHWAGSYSPWHRELYGADTYDPPTFTTLAEAQAFIATAGEPEDVSSDGQIARFRWDIERASVENREKWSMGHGYYLADSKYSGWQVRKGNESWMLQGDTIQIGAHLLNPRTEAEPPTGESATIDGIAVTLNADKGGVEIRFPSKPAASVLSDLKSHGWRWSRFSACWYQRDTQQAREMAARISGQAVADTDEGHAPDFDRLIEEQRESPSAWGD